MERFNEIIRHHEKFIAWAENLKNVGEEQWLEPVEEGKWSIGEILAHLTAWDQFTLENRIPSIRDGAELPPFPDFQLVNDEAAKHAKSGISRDELVDEFTSTRSSLVDAVRGYTPEELSVSFTIGTHQLTLLGYLEDFLHHDLHHQAQINDAAARLKA